MEQLINFERRGVYIMNGVRYVSSQTSFPVVCIYLLAVTLAPLWIKVTKPLQLRYILVVYNMLCCVVAGITFTGLSRAIYQQDSFFSKQSDDAITRYLYLYYITKYLELLDTVFMIVRHKTRQISWLHIYHHASILLLSDITFHDYPWITISNYLALNSFVHFFLYLYYGLSALNPDAPPPWKKLMTQLQILQFAVGLVHSFYGYLYHGFCLYSIFYGVVMTSMFLNFYYHAYMKKATKQKKNG